MKLAASIKAKRSFLISLTVANDDVKRRQKVIVLKKL